MEIAVPVYRHRIAGVYDNCGASVFNNGWAGQRHAGLELVTVEALRRVAALERVVDI